MDLPLPHWLTFLRLTGFSLSVWFLSFEELQDVILGCFIFSLYLLLW